MSVWEGEGGEGDFSTSRNGPPLAAARKSAAPNTKSRFPFFLLGKQDIFSEETQEASRQGRVNTAASEPRTHFGWCLSLSLVSRNWDGWMRGVFMVAKARVTKLVFLGGRREEEEKIAF